MTVKHGLKLILMLFFTTSLWSIPLATIVNPSILDSSKSSLIVQSSSTHIDVGAWIIIGGDRSDHDKVELIKYGCNEVYQILLDKGFSADDIYYMAANVGTPYAGLDNYTTFDSIEYAFTDWVSSRINSTHALGMYLFDHGGWDYMCIPGSPELTASDLDGYLDSLETDTGCDRFIIVYEACHAGSFIDNLSQDNRIILTATDAEHNSSANPDWTWATFSEGFWSSIAAGDSIGEAFEAAEAFVESTGHGDTQFPWIDDNHDGDGHETDAGGSLPNGGDGTDALDCYFGNPLYRIRIPILIEYPRWDFHIPEEIVIPYWVRISSTLPIKGVHLRIIPEQWTCPPPQIGGEEKAPTFMGENLTWIPLVDSNNDQNYTGTIDRRVWANYLSEWGEYQVCVYVKGENGMRQFGTSFFDLTENETMPDDEISPEISILTPSTPNEILQESSQLRIQATDDKNLETVQIFLNGDIIHEEKMPDYLPYPDVEYILNTKGYANGDYNLTAIAIDGFGNKAQDSIQIQILNTFDFFALDPLILLGLLGLVAVGVITLALVIRHKRK